MNKIDYIIGSFPRSGNHWVRYVLEWFSGRPTLGDAQGEHSRDRNKNPKDTPIYKRAKIPHVNGSANPIAKKRHNINAWDNRSAGLIFIVRNYKECITRHISLSKKPFKLQDQPFNGYLASYLQQLVEFDKWGSNKLLIHYEDLVDNPRDTIKSILQFTKLYNEQQFEAFMMNLQWHKTNALGSLHDNGITKGEKTIFHSQKLDAKTKHEFDAIVAAKNPQCFDKYLTRYKEHEA